MIPILVIKDTAGKLYHLRMDKPFERPLAKLFTFLAEGENSPRSIGSAWVEDMDEEQYLNIDQVTGLSVLPSFINNQ